MPDPATWGTVGQWVGGIGTILAFTATFYVIRRDAEVRRYTQARKIIFYYDWVPSEKKPTEGGQGHQRDHIVRNLSDEPIYSVMFFDVTTGEILKWSPILLPDEPAITYREELDEGHIICLRFNDNSGKEWDHGGNGRVTELPPRLWLIPRLHVKLQLWWLRKLRPHPDSVGIHRKPKKNDSS
jgi:hypothetical protein